MLIIGHYFNYWYQLGLKDVTDIVLSVLIMSFLVIIESLIAFMTIIIIEKMLISIIEKMLISIERIRNQKVDIISFWYQLSVHILSNYRFMGIFVKHLIGTSLI